MWKARLLTVTAALAAALVAARPAAAQEEQPDSAFLQTLAASSQCKIIPIIYKPAPPPPKIMVPPSVVLSISGDGCVCWKGVPPATKWTVDFPYGTPFSGGKTHFDNGDPCGDLARKGLYKYDVKAEGILLDPWLDVGS